MLNIIMNGWPILLIALLVATSIGTWGARSVTRDATWVGLILLWILAINSNVPRLVPLPIGEPVEAWKAWELEVSYATILAQKTSTVLILCYLLFVAGRVMRSDNRAISGTILIICTIIAGQFGEGTIEQGVCRYLDPEFGKLAEWYAAGNRGASCYRAGYQFHPWIGYVAPYITPAIVLGPMACIWIRAAYRLSKKSRITT